MPDGLSGDRQRLPVTIKCPKCHQTGSAIWEVTAFPNPRNLAPTLASLPDGFYHRIRDNRIGIPEVVCQKCDTVLLD